VPKRFDSVRRTFRWFIGHVEHIRECDIRYIRPVHDYNDDDRIVRTRSIDGKKDD
jgi:hypothetical protein